MEIEKVGGVPQPLRQETEGAESKTGKLSEKEKKDSLVVSAETKKIYEYVEMIKRMPGVREEKVKAVKEKIVKDLSLHSRPSIKKEFIYQLLFCFPTLFNSWHKFCPSSW